jgi:hypothetical protein
MAKILTFRPGEMRPDESGLASSNVSAEVIVFPGVRYERWNDVGEGRSQLRSATKKRSQNRQRDILELAE